MVIAVVSTLALFSTASWAEFYFGGAVGGNFPFGLNDVKLKSVNNQPVDIQLEDSLAYGGKAGYFFSSVDWLGVEVEAFNSNPNFKPTTVTVGGFPVNVGAIDLRVTTAAANLVARYPGNRFEPYIGIGPGAFVARISRGGNSQTSVVPGLNVIGGGRFYLTDWLALFTEYKFNYARFDFDEGAIGFQGTYLANHVHGGISFHFK
ncbi:hypothetical protein YTPLAS18_21140 [Nitrospira sp.]|nr:hypothetical protein YTPLAS18_21140 [Nitrospira sp.]